MESWGLAGENLKARELLPPEPSVALVDQYEVRSWTAWHRFMTLCMMAMAWVASVRHAVTSGPPPSREARSLGTAAAGRAGKREPSNPDVGALVDLRVAPAAAPDPPAPQCQHPLPPPLDPVAPPPSRERAAVSLPQTRAAADHARADDRLLTQVRL